MIKDYQIGNIPQENRLKFQELIKLAIDYKNNEQYEKARDCYFMAHDIDPYDASVLFHIAGTYYSCNQHDKTIEFCDKSIAIDANVVWPYIIKGHALRDINKHIDAIESYHLGLKNASNIGDESACYYSLTQGYIEARDFPNADKYFDKYFQLVEYPGYPNSKEHYFYNYFGMMYFEHGNYKRAIECISIAISLTDKKTEFATFDEYSDNIMRIYWRKGNYFRVALTLIKVTYYAMIKEWSTIFEGIN